MSYSDKDFCNLDRKLKFSGNIRIDDEVDRTE